MYDSVYVVAAVSDHLTVIRKNHVQTVEKKTDKKSIWNPIRIADYINDDENDLFIQPQSEKSTPSSDRFAENINDVVKHRSNNKPI